MRKFLSILILIIAFSSSVNAFPKQESEKIFIQTKEIQNISDQANVLYAQNDIKQSFELLKSIPEGERSEQNWLLLGNLLQDQGKIFEAESMYKKAIELDEKFYKAHYNLANIYLAENKPNLAVSEYKLVIKNKPDYAYAHYNLACAYIKLEKYSKAKNELLTAIDLKNNVADFHYNLAYVYKKLNKEKAAQAYLDKYNKLKENDV